MVLNNLERVFFPASDDYPAGCIVEVHCTEKIPSKNKVVY